MDRWNTSAGQTSQPKMKQYLPLIFASVLILIFGLIEVILIRFLQRDWWRKRWIKLAAICLPLVGVICIVLWGYGTYSTVSWARAVGATGTSLALICLTALMFSLPFSGIISLVGRLIDRLQKKRPGGGTRPVDHKRRVFLKGTAVALPAISLSAGVSGVAHGFQPAVIPTIPMTYPDLPSELAGLKILHISDFHLGLFKDLPDLEYVLGVAKDETPDLILVTGDLSDHLNILPDVLKMIDQFNAPLGHFACLGNHEYYRGIVQVRRAFDAGPVPLLVGKHVTINVQGQPLVIAGADDPRVMGEDDTTFLYTTTNAAMDGTPSDGFTVLMSHRPEGLDAAAEIGIELTLAGHTHGGQFGLFGRSVFEPMLPHRYLWGKYEKDKSQLYTSAGVGHWFPFRLGCPPEAPIIVLEKG